MNALYTLAFPRISRPDADRLEAFRRRHDPHHEIVAAHFTMVFACKAVEERTYIEHIELISRSSLPVSFNCRFAMLGTDDEIERGYVYLVPDEGFSGISRLHDALYGGPLSAHLRLDIPFVPHITLGASADRTTAKRLCDELNSSGLAIHGTIDALSVAALQDGRIRILANFPLGAVGFWRP